MPELNTSSLSVPSGLKRYPVIKKDLLQAWDAADELLLQNLSERDLEGKRILILNDSFGALSCALQGHDVTTYVDSFVAAKGLELNSQGNLRAMNLLDELQGTYDLAVVRIPKNMSFFDDLLCHLSQRLNPGAEVICGYMVKHQANAAFDLLNQRIGETSTSLAQKKARLIFAKLERPPTASPYPIRLAIEGFEHPFANHSNLFSREKLDIGTRFLLDHIPQGAYASILDLGCGNGIIGIAAKVENPKAKILFSDDSMMAVLSAQANYASHFSDSAEYHWTNCFEVGKPASVDLVLCNPPFHQGNTLGDHIAKQMFADAHRVLKPGGILRVIGNSHLGYQQPMKKLFGNSRTVATNAKFMIIDAVRD